MIKEIIQTGISVDAAIESGCLLLGVSKSDAEFEIIDLPRKTLFGLKKIPAKVRVFIELPDPEPVKQAPVAAPVATPKPIPQEKPATPVAAPQKTQPTQEQSDNSVPYTPSPSTLAKGQAVEEYVRSVMTCMGVSDLQISARYTSNGLRLSLSGSDIGVVIGRRGETLDSLQYLSGLVANRIEGDYLRVTIDSGNYRAKRERTLEAIARKLAGQAVKTGRNQTLEPMNPYERRIIHATVSQINGAVSTSIGEEPNRRVVIKSANPSNRSGGGGRGGHRGPRPGGGRGGHGGPRGNNPRHNSRPQQQQQEKAAPAPSTVAPKPTSQPKPVENQGVHLYGKIEL